MGHQVFYPHLTEQINGLENLLWVLSYSVTFQSPDKTALQQDVFLLVFCCSLNYLYSKGQAFLLTLGSFWDWSCIYFIFLFHPPVCLYLGCCAIDHLFRSPSNWQRLQLNFSKSVLLIRWASLTGWRYIKIGASVCSLTTATSELFSLFPGQIKTQGSSFCQLDCTDIIRGLKLL